MVEEWGEAVNVVCPDRGQDHTLPLRPSLLIHRGLPRLSVEVVETGGGLR